MENKYSNYINAFNELSKEDKRIYILENLDEILKVLYKVNIDYNKFCDTLPMNEYESEEEYLNEIFKKIVSLKGVSAGVLEIIGENLYEGVGNE